MMRHTEGASKAVWDYVQQHAPNEFKDVKLLAFHTHAGGVFHMVNKPITQAADLRGVKVRAPTRQTTKMLAALGAAPVGMPVPQVPDALAKGVIDGALLPYEVVPAIKAQELTKFHSEPDSAQPTLHTSVFIFAMNKAKYDALPADLKKIIDANSGQALSAQMGRTFAEADATNRKLLKSETINIIAGDEIERIARHLDRMPAQRIGRRRDAVLGAGLPVLMRQRCVGTDDHRRLAPVDPGPAVVGARRRECRAGRDGTAGRTRRCVTGAREGRKLLSVARKAVRFK